MVNSSRGFEYQDLVFDIPEEGGITFDVARLERERELEKRINKERDQLLADERRLDQIFGLEKKKLKKI
jgi:hypothetical protein